MRRTLYRQDRLNGSSRGSEDGSSTCGESITASDVSKESGFDNKSEISEGERSSPGILMKQKIWVQNIFSFFEVGRVFMRCIGRLPN